MDKNFKITVNTHLVRAAYTWLNKPRVNEEKDGEQEWGFTGILGPLDSPGVQALAKTANEVLRGAFGPEAKFGPQYRSPFRKEETYSPCPEEFKGKIMLPMFSKNRPIKIADINLQPIAAADQIYSGMWVHANVTAYAWETKKGAKGVSFGLNSVMKAKDDTPLSGAPSDPANDFKDLDRSAYMNDGSVAMGSGADLSDI